MKIDPGQGSPIHKQKRLVSRLPLLLLLLPIATVLICVIILALERAGVADFDRPARYLVHSLVIAVICTLVTWVVFPPSMFRKQGGRELTSDVGPDANPAESDATAD
jgi:hypothetical protein